MDYKFCQVCGTALTGRELGQEGVVPFCTTCDAFRFPLYNVAVSMIVIDEKTGRILLIQQYGRPFYILVAGYVNRGESAEQAVVREIKEETGMTVSRMQFNRTKFFEPSNTLMCNFTAYVRDGGELCVNDEVDSYRWFTREEAGKNVKENSLASEFLHAYLAESTGSAPRRYK